MAFENERGRIDAQSSRYRRASSSIDDHEPKGVLNL